MTARKSTGSKAPNKTASATSAASEDVKAKGAKVASIPSAEPKVQQPSRWQLIVRRAGRFIARTSAPEVMLVATLAMARYLTNSDFSYPSEIVLNIVLLGVVVSAAYYVFLAVLRRSLPAHVAGLLFAYSMYSFQSGFPRLHKVAEALIPDSATQFTHMMLTVLIFGLLFGLVGYGVKQLVQHSETVRSLPLLKFMVFVISFIFITQVGKVGLRVWDIRHFLTYKQQAVHLQQAKTAPSDKPNVYYLLFDRYASADTLKKDYNYDNSSFMNFLTSKGFVNRDGAYANYPFTMMSVSSTLAMDYHTQMGEEFKNQATDFQAGFPYRTILDNPPVAQALKSRGYQYNQVSSWWDFTRNVPTADTEPTESFRLRILSKTFWLTDLQRDIVNKSVLSPLLLKGITAGSTAIVKYDHDRNPAQNFAVEMQALKTIAVNSKTQKAPQFTFAHVLSPHDPYVFDENGNNPAYGGDRDDNGVDETVKYTNQLSYINTQIKDMVSTLRQKDPTAVIVMQTDEGPYPKQFRGTLTKDHFYDPADLPVPQMRQKFGVLASYYMPGVSDDKVRTNITSSVNAFRFVLNQYAGYQLPLLPDCQFAVGDKFKLFNYQLVTGQLKSAANPPECKQYL
jgi:hypothetical protein